MTCQQLCLLYANCPQQNGFIQEQQRIVIQNMQFNGEPLTSLKNKGGECLFMDLEKSCYKGRIHWRKLNVPSIVTFHWLRYGSCPLAELLLDKEELFLLPAEVAI